MIKRGDTVYRVCEFDDHDKPPTWRVAESTVKSIGKLIVLRSFLPGVWRRQFELSALGLVFHESKIAALKAFSAEAQAQAETLARKRDHALEASRWAFHEYRILESACVSPEVSAAVAKRKTR